MADDVFKELHNFMQRDLPSIVATEGLNFIKQNFKDEGFNDNGLKKWASRKTVDKRGRNNTRYRTNRVGRAGELNQHGRRNQGRAILTGHATGGNKLRNSHRATESPTVVKFITSKEYAEAHNEGNKFLPKRPFIGKSAYLERKIEAKIHKTLLKIFRNG